VRAVIAWVLLLVWLGSVLALCAILWRKAKRVGLDKKRAAERWRAAQDRRREEGHLERVVREATAAGAVVAVSRRGSNPTRVTWSDGSVWFFYDDSDRFQAAQSRGIAAVGSTYVGPAPALGAPRPTRTS
jgi:hypothetical protein